ncbi:MAG: glycosyltransferase family 4 protein [Coriobacteriia bacterium]
MRILLLSQFYPPVTGGVEVHVAALARGLAERGHRVMVATLDGAETGDGRRVRVDVRRVTSAASRAGFLFSTDRRHAPPVPDPGVMLGLRRLVVSFRPEIVHAHNWLGRSFLPLARSAGARFIVTLHDCGAACAQGRRMHRGEEYCVTDGLVRCTACCASFYGPVKGTLTALGNRLMRSHEAATVDLYVAVSRAVAEANLLDASGARYAVVPNFVTEPSAHPRAGTPELGTLPSEPFVLQVGDVVPDKGVSVLLDAFRRLPNAPPLVLLGRIAPGLRGSLPPGVFAPGLWPHGLIAEAWRRSLFGTMPSICLDACPTSAMEAMAAGRAVVASARGGLSDIVDDGVTGILVPPGDSGALAAAMRRIAEDPQMRQRMGRAGRERFERRFRSDVVIERIESLYQSVLSG